MKNAKINNEIVMDHPNINLAMLMYCRLFQ